MRPTPRLFWPAGAAFLRDRQAEDGRWSPDRNEPGITALVVTALLRSGQVTANEPTVTRALDYLASFVQPDGADGNAPHANYTTAIAIMAFQAASERGNKQYDPLIKGGRRFLTNMQWDETEGKDPSDPFYGGAGYGGKNNRPDLSNTSFMIEALRESGLPADDPALQKALRFVSRCQNLDSEFNDQPWADKVNDGGFIYTAANGGQSMAGEAPGTGGGLRSYAGMTYAGLKSMIYAGLTPDDPRVARRPQVHQQQLHPRLQPRPRPARPLLLLPHLRQGPRPPRRGPDSPTPPAPHTTGGPNFTPPSPTARTPTEAGSTPPTASWKATPTSSPPMPSSP